MVLLHLIKKESLQIFRNRTALLMMVIFPIVMIVILSFAFKSSFNAATTVPKLTVRYQLEGKNRLSKEFSRFFEGIKQRTKARS